MSEKRINIENFVEGTKVEGNYVLASHTIKPTKTGSEFLSVVIKDKTGMISGNIWNIPEDTETWLKDGDIIHVSGAVVSYRETLQFNFNEIRGLEKDEIKVSDREALVPMISEDIDKLYGWLLGRVGYIEDESLRMLGNKVLKDFENDYKFYPAAKMMHHAEIGGLLLHTTEVASLIEKIHQVRPWFDKDLTVLAGILHDFGKIREFSIASTGLVSDYSMEGNLLGHIYMGAEDIGKYCNECSVSEEKKILLQHMILSHHGGPDFGSPVRPSTMEAYILHVADELSAKMHMYQDAIENVEPGNFSEKIFGLDGIRVYNPQK